jgi:branched-subunit amino acid ABC-type transport system permease component
LEQLVSDSLVRAAILSLIGIGFVTTYFLTRFLNIAHVEFATVGAYATWLLTHRFSFGLLLSASLVIPCVGLMALVMGRTVFRRLLRSGHAMAILGSLAISFVIRGFIHSLAGPRPRHYALVPEPAVPVMGALVTPNQVRIAAITAVVISAWILILYASGLGRRVRAVGVNQQLAEVSGINSNRIVDLGWFVSGGLAALAGVLIGMEVSVQLNMGWNLLLPAAAVAILGGLATPLGSVLAALLVSGAENGLLAVNWMAPFDADPYRLSLTYRPAIGFVVLVLALMFRPEGLLSRRRRVA